MCWWLLDMKSGTQDAENQEIPGLRRSHTRKSQLHHHPRPQSFTLVDVPMADLIFITVERRPDTANALHRKDGEHGTEYSKLQCQNLLIELYRQEIDIVLAD